MMSGFGGVGGGGEETDRRDWRTATHRPRIPSRLYPFAKVEFFHARQWVVGWGVE